MGFRICFYKISKFIWGMSLADRPIICKKLQFLMTDIILNIWVQDSRDLSFAIERGPHPTELEWMPCSLCSVVGPVGLASRSRRGVVFLPKRMEVWPTGLHQKWGLTNNLGLFSRWFSIFPMENPPFGESIVNIFFFLGTPSANLRQRYTNNGDFIRNNGFFKAERETQCL